MVMAGESNDKKLKEENEALRLRLAEAEATLEAIRNGEVDGLVVSTKTGKQVFTLRGADEPYRILVEKMGEGALSVDPEGTIFYCNRHFAELVKAPLETIIGSPVFPFIVSADAGTIKALLDGRETSEEISLRPREGPAVPALISVTPWQVEGLPGFCAVVTDLREKKKRDEILAAEKLARYTINQASEPLVVCDTEGRIIRASQAAADLYGSNPLYQHFDAVFPLRRVAGSYSGKETPETAAPINFAAIAVGHTVKDIETVYRREDGETFRLLLSSGPLLDGQSRPLGYVITLVNITRRVQAEEKLFETTRRLQALMDALPVGVSFSDDPTCRHITGNPRVLAQFEVGTEDNLSASAPDINAPGRQIHFFREGRKITDSELPLQRAVAENKTIPPIELEVVLPSGHRWFTAASGSPIRNQQGNVIGGVAVTVDITERKRMEEELRKAKEELELRVRERTAELARSNADLERFAYVCSHDLQEPLRMVASYVELLKRQYKDKLGADANEFIEFASEGAQRMSKMIKDLLEYSRVNTRPRVLEPTDAEAVLKRAIKNLEFVIEEVRGEVTHEPLPRVTVDGTQLLQVFQNLISNAIKFHKDNEDPRIHVTAESQGGKCIFRVRDNGLGIEKQYFDRIFVPFQRLHANRAKYPGTGIGLAIVKRVVERYGGEAWVESEFGEGSTFCFSLPEG